MRTLAATGSRPGMGPGRMRQGVAARTAGAPGSLSSLGPEGFKLLSSARLEETGIGPVMQPVTSSATAAAITRFSISSPHEPHFRRGGKARCGRC